jgi:parvulin-like peptidyl-prolyl isomerase
MILKLKKILILAGVGLVAVGAITPIVASCSKSSNNSTDPDLLYTSKSVEDLFEQFIGQYKTLAMDNSITEDDIDAAISGFKAQLKEKEEETADLPDSDKFTQRSE